MNTVGGQLRVGTTDRFLIFSSDQYHKVRDLGIPAVIGQQLNVIQPILYNMALVIFK